MTNTISIRPLANRVLVKVTKKEEKTASGLYIPDAQQKPSNKAEVVAVGPMADNLLGVGCTVIINPNCGVKIEEEGEEYLLMFDGDVLAVIL